jgi:hypothetical protein
MAATLRLSSTQELAMPFQLEVEEEIAQERRERAAERRVRNMLAIAEVVGRYPARIPADERPPISKRDWRLDFPSR